MTDDDAHLLHAQRFLDRLQRLSTRVRTTGDDIEPLLVELNRCWPQVLRAFWWASSRREQQSFAARLGDEFMACAGGDANIEYRRNADDLRRWAYAARDYASRLCDNPNDAAFLYRFAGVALVESGIVEVAQKTRMQISDVLAVAKKVIERQRGEKNDAPPDQDRSPEQE